MGHVRSCAIALLSAFVPLSAQWLHYPSPGIPRTPDGKVNLSAPTPKTRDGKPDFSGIWEISEQRMLYPPWTSHFMDLAVDLKGGAPMQPWAKAVSEKRQDNLHKDDPLSQCMPPGVPRVDTIAPFKIVQTGQIVIVLYETPANSTFRQIFTD